MNLRSIFTKKNLSVPGNWQLFVAVQKNTHRNKSTSAAQSPSKHVDANPLLSEHPRWDCTLSRA